MKKLLTVATLLSASVAGICQVEVSNPDSAASFGRMSNAAMAENASHPLKTNTQVTPRWTLDADYRYGWIDQTLENIDLAQAYTNSLSTSSYTNSKFTDGRSVGAELSLSWFFNKKHTLGLGFGAMFMRHSGRLSMDSFKADYQDVDRQNRIYRQIVRSNGLIGEDIEINNVNVPILLKFKSQFRGFSPFGVWIDAGPVFSVYNTTNTTRVDGTFSYEAIYRLSGQSMSIVSGFDDSPNPESKTSLILTEDFLARTGGGTDPRAFFDRERSLPHQYNVGLYKSPASNSNRPANEFTELSIGGMAQAGISYALSYRVTFNLGYYFMYQSFRNEGNTKKHITDRVIEEGTGFAGNYFGLSKVLSRADYTSHGIRAGLRIFLGGKGRDIDGDGYIDSRDDCPGEWGTVEGCPDSDGDGIKNSEDVCPDEYGSVITRGCKDDDGDGFANREDSCRDEPGQFKGCPIEYFAKALVTVTPDSTLRGPTGVVMAPHIVLETDLLYFDSKMAVINDTAARILDNAVRILSTSPTVIIHISGYTDAIGSFANNLVLSYERARSAKQYLVAHGIPQNRVIIAGYGNENPIAQNDSEQDRAKNRRIEMRLLLPVE